MNKTVAIQNLSLFNFSSPGETAFGCDQGWYPSWWKRQSGCGPSTAANQFAYLANELDNAKNLCQIAPPFNKNNFVPHMQSVWRYITPGMGGTNSTKKFVDGAMEYLSVTGVDLKPRVLDIAPFNQRPNDQTIEKVIAFIVDGLQKNCPIAFLNLSNGKVENLHQWHWITIVKADITDDKQIFVTVSDEGDKKVIDLSLWFATTTKEGGFVYFCKE